MMISVGIINEKKKADAENRVALTPQVIKGVLAKNGDDFEFLVESEAGKAAHNYDEQYVQAGAKVVSHKDAVKADVVLFVNTPGAETVKTMKEGALAISFFNSAKNQEIVEVLKKEKVRAIDINKLPRKLSNAQTMDAITSQSSISGYKAAVLAACEYAKIFPMLTTAAGTIRPASVLVLGAGIAGLQAVATAKRLGAIVSAFDVRPEAKEEVLSLGANFLDLSKYVPGEQKDAFSSISKMQGEGGLARRLTAEELAIQKNATDQAVGDFDILITTAQVPGFAPPEFVSMQGVKNMKPGSVIVDMAASNMGGNVEGSKPNQTVLVDGVKIIGAPDLASNAATAASELLAKNFMEILLHFTKKTEQGTVIDIDLEDELAKNMVLNIDNQEEK
jgi:NAD(P) transhydrogenase subunit alpha